MKSIKRVDWYDLRSVEERAASMEGKKVVIIRHRDQSNFNIVEYHRDDLWRFNDGIEAVKVVDNT